MWRGIYTGTDMYFRNAKVIWGNSEGNTPRVPVDRVTSKQIAEAGPVDRGGVFEGKITAFLRRKKAYLHLEHY